MFTLKKAQPEDYGIPLSAVAKMEELYEKLGVRMHGYMLIGGDKILAERYYEPYGKQENHRMYSVTKSFVAVAVGLLVQKGMIKLSDKICDYFPEKLPKEGVHPWCQEMTIEDMLTMRTCHASTTYKAYDSDDWTESFFHVKPTHVPGTVFHYDTSSSHVLAALVEKLTGMKMLDFMRKEILDELGFSKEAYVIPDPVGVSQGGSGMMSTLRDVACVAYLCNHYGVVDGKELLSPDYVRRATSNQVPTDLQPSLDERAGYGYFIWMPREEGFVFYGMGGQLAVCFPKLDFIYMTMADTIGSPAGLQLIYDCFYQTVYPYLQERREENPLAFVQAEEAAKGTKCMEQSDGTQLPTSGTYQFAPNKLDWRSVTFDWGKGEMHFEIPEGEFCLSFELDTWKKQLFLNTGFQCECRGYWKQGHFFLEAYMIGEEQGHVRMDFAWKDNRLGMRFVSTNDPFINSPGLKKHFQGSASAELSKKIIDLFLFMGQSNMAGRGITSKDWKETVPTVIPGAGYEFRAISDPTKLYEIAEPFGRWENNAEGIDDGDMKTGSMVTSFANEYYKNNGNIPIVGISASKGGSVIEQWIPGSNYFTDTVKRLRAGITYLEQNNFSIRHQYMLWCQGESDGDIQTDKETYLSRLNSMWLGMKEQGIEKLFLVCIGCCNIEGSYDRYDDMREWQMEFAEGNEDVVIVADAFVDMLKRGLMKDEFHYYQQGYNECGEIAGECVAYYVKTGEKPHRSRCK